MLTIINPIHANSRNHGNLLKGIDKKTVRKENIEPIKRVYTYALFSKTLFIWKQNCSELHFLYTVFQKRIVSAETIRGNTACI